LLAKDSVWTSYNYALGLLRFESVAFGEVVLHRAGLNSAKVSVYHCSTNRLKADSKRRTRGRDKDRVCSILHFKSLAISFVTFPTLDYAADKGYLEEEPYDEL